MITYVYLVKCPNCEDEYFDFFDEAKAYALGCISNQPIITQTEVNRNDFGECTDHCDLGTVWSWEDMMTDAEPTKSIFTKDDLKDYIPDEDPEFASIDNSVDYEIDEISDSLNEFVDSHGNKVSIRGGAITSTATQAPSVQTPPSKTLDNIASQLAMADVGVSKEINVSTDKGGYNVSSVTIKAPFSKEKMSYGANFKYKDLFIPAAAVIRQIFDRTGINFKIDPQSNSARRYFPETVRKIWAYVDDKDILLINYPGFNFIIDKNDLIAQLNSQVSGGSTSTNESCRKPIPAGMTIEELVETMEENEDTVECTKCGGLFEKAGCTHNKEGFGWCCTNCETPDTLVEDTQDTVDLEYDKLAINLRGSQRDADDWDDIDYEDSYTYTIPKSEAANMIWDFMTEEDATDVPGGLAALEDDETWNAFIETHFDELFEKYYDKLLEYCRELAAQEFADNYSYDDYRADRASNYGDWLDHSQRDDF